MSRDVLLNTGHAVSAREIDWVLLLAVRLSICIELVVSRLRSNSGRLEPRIGIFQLDRWIDSITTSRQVGVHMRRNVMLQISKRPLDIIVFLVSLIDIGSEFNHRQVICAQGINTHQATDASRNQ
jgi:hypothetical protein